MGATGMSGHCEICNEDIDPGGPWDVVGHIRTMHPDEYKPPETWADGGLVIHEEPTDLGEAFDGGDLP
jgi:hypothetical protein